MFQGAGLTILLVLVGIVYKLELLDVLKEKFQETVRNEESLSHAFFCIPDEIGYMFDYVDNVMQRLGSKSVSRKDLESGYWNVLWSREYITAIPFDFAKLRKHQKVNHIPGIYYLVSKSHLTVGMESKFIPKSYLNAAEVMEAYTDLVMNKKPAKRYVRKSKTNGEIQIMNVFELNFENKDEFSGYFAQEYVENPLLIGGHKFEFSIDVLITSVNPLRVYYYDKNIELLFTKKPYDSSVAANVDSYVIGESRISAESFPGIEKYLNRSLNYKEALNAELKHQKINVQKVWDQVEEAIRTAVTDKEKYFTRDVSFTVLYEKLIDKFLVEF